MKRNQSMLLLVLLSSILFACGMDQRAKEASEAKRSADSLLKGLEKVSKELDSISNNAKAAGDSIQKSMDAALKDLKEATKE